MGGKSRKATKVNKALFDRLEKAKRSKMGKIKKGCTTGRENIEKSNIPEIEFE